MANVVMALMATLGLDSSEFDKGLKNSESTASKVGNGLKKGLATGAKLATGALVAGSSAVVAFGKKAVDAGKDFDASMSQVAATMGVSTDAVKDLRDFAQEMGRTTAFSATQSAEALNYMALAGYDAEKSMKMLPNVLNLASAGGMELAKASDMVTDAQSALGLSTEETEAMVDQMAKTSSKSNTSVSQLGDAILTIGATAQSIKGGTTELNTLLGVLADNGIKGAEGGTHLRNMILSLTNPTDKASEKLEDLGVKVYDAQGNMRSMIDIVKDLKKGTENLTGAQKDLAIGTIFNRADMASINALLSTTGERFDELTGYIEDAKGSASEMANTQLDNLAGDITLFKSALEGAQIAVSDKLTPSIRGFVKLGTSGLSKVTEAFQKDGIAGAFGELGGVISDALKMVTEKSPEIIKAGVNLLSALGKGIVDNAPMVFSTVIPQMFNAILQLGGEAGSALTKLLPMVAKMALDLLNMGINTLLDNIDVIIPQIVNMLTSIVQVLADNAPALIPKLVELVYKIGEILTDPEVMEPLMEAGSELLIALTKGLADSVPILLKGVSSILVNMVGLAKKWIPILITTVGGIVVELVRSLGTSLGDMLYDIFGTKIYDIIQKVKDKVNSAREFIGEQVQKIKDFFSNLTLKLPEFKLPHFKLEGEFSLKPPRIPKVGVDWYAKAYDEAYMLNSATIFGAQGGKLLGGGERAGSEVVVGTNKLIGMMSTAVRNAFDGLVLEANIPVYIGNKKLEDIIVKTQATMKMKRGK